MKVRGLPGSSRRAGSGSLAAAVPVCVRVSRSLPFFPLPLPLVVVVFVTPAGERVPSALMNDAAPHFCTPMRIVFLLFFLATPFVRQPPHGENPWRKPFFYSRSMHSYTKLKEHFLSHEQLTER